MLFTPPFVEGWRNNLRLQSKSLHLTIQPLSLSDHRVRNKFPNTVKVKPQKQSPAACDRPLFKLGVSDGKQYTTRHPPVRYPPPKAMDRRCRNPGRYLPILIRLYYLGGFIQVALENLFQYEVKTLLRPTLQIKITA